MIPAETGERARGGATEPWGPAAGARYAGLPESAPGGVSPAPQTNTGEGRLTTAGDPGHSPTACSRDLDDGPAAL
jgi:hypothetical protein